MRMFVTGAAGFIGAAMTRRLLALGYDVHVLVKPTTNLWRLHDIKKTLVFHTIDITDIVGLTKLFNKIRPEGIFHFAARGAYAGESDLSEMMRINIDGTVSLLQASMHIPYKVFVNIGSSAEYGIKNSPMKETDLSEPVNLYAATKVASTVIAQTFARLHNKPIVTLRPFTVYGPYEELFRFIPTIISSTIGKKSIPLTKDLVRHDLIYIDDFVDACLKAFEKGSVLTGQIINIGTGREYTNQEVVDLLFEIIGSKTRIVRGSFLKRRWDSKHWVADTTLSKRILNWQANITLAKGLKKTYIWFAANRDIYEKLPKK